MISVSIIGYGNLGFHLVEGFRSSEDILIDQIITSRDASIPDILFQKNIETVLPGSDVYLLCVPDDHIADISEKLQYALPPTSFICHVSGTGSIDLIHPVFFIPYKHSREIFRWSIIPFRLYYPQPHNGK